MNAIRITAILLVTFLLGSCKEQETVAVNARESAIEIQLVVREAGFEPGNPINSGNIKVVKSHVLPVPDEGGSGWAVSVVDGARIKASWSRSEPYHNPCAKEEGVLLEGFSLKIASDVCYASDRYNLAVGPGTLVFTSDFQHLTTPLSTDHRGNEKDAPCWFFRARWLPSLPPAAEIDLDSAIQAFEIKATSS